MKKNKRIAVIILLLFSLTLRDKYRRALIKIGFLTLHLVMSLMVSN